MGTVAGQSVGIDISEDFLDVYLSPAGKEMRYQHNDEGIASSLELLRVFNIDRIFRDRTGGLQRRPTRSLQEARYAVSMINPERIWANRRLVGRVAKPDRIDARLIAEVRRDHATRGERPARRIAAGDAGVDRPS